MPSITRVIEVHQELESASNAPMLIISEILWIFFGIVFIVHLLKDRKSFSLLGLSFRGLFFVITLLIIGYLTNSIMNCNFSINETQWKKGYLKPYILSLPEHKKNVDDFSLLLNNEVNGINSIYINGEKPLWFKISLLDKHRLSKKIVLQCIIQKEPIKKPFLTYKKINKNISGQYTTNAYYETILHIPEEYKVITPKN
ncbi:hypothetical protein E2K98_30270 [Bacillus salipaludis]|uniref:Uncharacterized protein n=1 Tax=Bacillus salipaludis TaxID=2547811 RepID=A0A4R5VH38_9BACI|nr:hypothetical protein [Bacillus salipaludis]MDQ6596445.1 hypothetical protein [Bacillus salipaludis]TDK53361.1 hypothetical protein E2K98_30270 [Bacillus salipaludis]